MDAIALKYFIDCDARFNMKIYTDFFLLFSLGYQNRFSTSFFSNEKKKQYRTEFNFPLALCAFSRIWRYFLAHFRFVSLN